MVAAVAVTVSLVAALVAAACTRVPRDAKPPTDELAAIAYTDVAGQNRRITLEVRVPDHVDGSEVPAVVWSHGGSTGRRTPTHVGVGWGRVMNEAGVAFVAIAHPGRSDDDRVALCAATGAADCATFNPLMWDRPHDVVAVLDWVEANATRLGIDASRLVYGGHSAGATGALMVAGMEPPMITASTLPIDQRPIGFIAASPPGTEVRGLSAASFVDLDRPVLLLSGSGDSTRSTSAADRRTTFDLLAGDLRFSHYWAHDELARHGTFDLDPSSCRRSGGTRRGCRDLVESIAMAGVGFVESLAPATSATTLRNGRD